MQSINPNASPTDATAATGTGATACTTTTMQLAQLEAMVEAQNMELEALRSAHREMAQTAEYLRVLAHQIRTPLGTILAAIGLMESTHQDPGSMEECAEYSGFITTAVRRLDAMAESACLLGCLNGGIFPAQRNQDTARRHPQGEGSETLDNVLRAGVQQAWQQESEVRQALQAQSQAASGRSPLQQRHPEVPVHVYGEVPQLLLTGRAAGILEICLTQLISNAIRYSKVERRQQPLQPQQLQSQPDSEFNPYFTAPDIGKGARSAATASPLAPGADVTLSQVLTTASLSPGGDQLCIRIRDYGIGMSEELGLRMFDPFRRGANARSIPGEGMGLYIARRCAQLLGGTLEIVGFSPQQLQEQQECAPCSVASSAATASPLEAPGPGVLARLQFPTSGTIAPPA